MSRLGRAAGGMIEARPSRHPLLSAAGTIFLAAGFASRLLMLDDIRPVYEAAAIGLLLLGSGLLMLDRALRGGAAASVLVLALPLLLLWAARSGEPASVKRAIDVWAACSAGFALRGLVRDRAGPAPVRGALAAAAVALSMFGLAQTLYLRAEVVRVAEETAHELTHSEQGRAFLGSWRATATFISPNAFGGFLLIAGIPLVAAALAAMAGATTRSVKTHAAFAVAIVAGGFACTGSAGAAVAAALGLTLAGWMSAESRRARIGFGLAATILLLAIGALVIAAARGSELSGKLRTLQERLDYHKAGLRLLDATWPQGTGLEQAGRLMARATRPGEAFSRVIHDWWLQGLVEGGVVFLPVAAVLVWVIVRGSRRALAPATSALLASGTAQPSQPRWWRALGAGMVLGLLLEPMVSVLPYGFGTPIVRAAATAAAFLAGEWLVRGLPVDGRAFTRGLAAGVLAFALHGFIDFDLAIPGVMLTFATALALLSADGPPARRDAAPSRTGCFLTGLYGAVNVLAPIAVVLFAETREHVH